MEVIAFILPHKGALFGPLPTRYHTPRRKHTGNLLDITLCEDVMDMTPKAKINKWDYIK